MNWSLQKEMFYNQFYQLIESGFDIGLILIHYILVMDLTDIRCLSGFGFNFDNLTLSMCLLYLS